MRARTLVAIGLLLPAGLTAQRIPYPRVVDRGPPRAVPLPPQAPEIARQLAYKRLNVSFESYPIVSYVHSPGFTGDGAVASWTSFGMGSRVEYRVSPHVSATLDMTSSFLGGPAITHTAEVGVRLRPERSERRFDTFVDVRVGYVHSYNTGFRPIGVDGFGTPLPAGYGGRFSEGVGGVGGVGMDYTLSRRFSLTTAGSIVSSRMTAHGFERWTAAAGRYWMMSYRYTLGLRFNPGRWIQTPGLGPS